MTNELEYILPEIYDQNNDTYSITFEDLPDFMVYNNLGNKFEFNLTNIIQNFTSTYSIGIILQDDNGAKNEYHLEINIIQNTNNQI